MRNWANAVAAPSAEMSGNRGLVSLSSCVISSEHSPGVALHKFRRISIWTSYYTRLGSMDVPAMYSL